MNKLEELERLGQLRADGEIAEGEFLHRKRELLAGGSLSAPAANRTRLFLGATAIVAALTAGGLWINDQFRGGPVATILNPAATATNHENTAADPTSPTLEDRASAYALSSFFPPASLTDTDSYKDAWDVTFEKEEGRCHAEAKGLPNTAAITADFMLKEGGLVLGVMAPTGTHFTANSPDATALMGTLKFSDGTTIRNNLSHIARVGMITIIVMDGVSFLESAKSSDFLDYTNANGDSFHLGLVGRHDLIQDTRACIDEAMK